MELHQAPDPAAAVARVMPFVMRTEAHNCLQVGALTRIEREPGRWGDSSLVWAEEAGEVVAVGLRQRVPLLLSAGLADAAAETLAEHASIAMPGLPSWSAPADAAERFTAAWRRLTGRKARLQSSARVLQVTEVTPPTRVPGDLRRYREEDRDLLVGWLRTATVESGFLEGHSQPGDSVQRLVAECEPYLWWHQGRPVSMAGIAEPTPNGARISSVYTPPDCRGRGYASACVAALSQRLLDSGYRFCFLLAEHPDPASDSVYERIGYRSLGSVDSWAAFELGPEPEGS